MSTREQQRKVYGALRHGDSMKMSELAELLGIKRVRMSTLLSNMYAGGMLTREGSPPSYGRSFDVMPADAHELAAMLRAYGLEAVLDAVEAARETNTVGEAIVAMALEHIEADEETTP